jgi:hypothetical protein
VFTAPELYLYLQKETAGRHRRMHELAVDATRQAEHAFSLKRGHSTHHFLPDCAWDDLPPGIVGRRTAGLALRHMEKAYLDENVREHAHENARDPSFDRWTSPKTERRQ